MAISIQIKGGCNHLGDHLSPFLINEINGIDNMMEKTKGRSIVDAKDFKSYRDKLIIQEELVVMGGA